MATPALASGLPVLVACAVAALLYLNLDSGIVNPNRSERLFSLPLFGLALIFALGAWTASMTSRHTRARLMAGLAAGVGGYALLRLALP